MNETLAVIAPKIGVRSETFIQRHMQDLQPKGTVVVAKSMEEANACSWGVDCPALILNELNNNLKPKKNFKQKTIGYFRRKIGLERDIDRVELSIQRFLREYKVKRILSEYLHLSFRFLKIAQELDIPFFVHAHGYDISRALQEPKWYKEYYQYNQAAGVITVSKVSRMKLIELGLTPSKVHVIPCGVDVPDKPFKRLEQDKIRCLAVGRMVSKKAPILLLAAFRQVANLCPYIHLDYVGTGVLLPAVRQFIQAFNLADRVTIHGGQSHDVVLQLMRKADIFLQHSITDPDNGDEEGLPVAILEAMAYTLPIVSTRHAGIPEAVLDGETGLLVDEGDCSGMADKILLLAQDSNLRSKLGCAAWQRAKKCFSWEQEKHNLLQMMKLS